MEVIRFVLTTVFLLIGIGVCAVGTFGVFRFKYAANRMHAAAINDTLGIGLCMLGLAISAPDLATAGKLACVVIFMWMSSPVASHLLCKLEIETNENRDEYMQVHMKTLAEEREEKEEKDA